MILWIDAQLSPHLAAWISDRFKIEAVSLYRLGMSTAEDYEIFEAARKTGATVITKDRDFIDLLTRHGPPPQVIWLRCGNTTNQRLKFLFESLLPGALELLQNGQNFVEIRDDKNETPSS